MLSGACHCGAVCWTLAERPQWLTRCNCSYCRRAGALWAQTDHDTVVLDYDPAAVVRYVHGDRLLAFISCANCGCTTHYESVNPTTDKRMKVNCAMADPADIAGVRIRHFDGAGTWAYLD